VTVVVLVAVPLLPETVMVRLPSEALLPTVIVIVELPAPVIEVGLKITEFWLPCPEADSEIVELNPPDTAEEIATWPELLLAMLTVFGDELIEKPGVVPVTVSDTVEVSTVLPEMPVTVML
jgi:hypothetical protein